MIKTKSGDINETPKSPADNSPDSEESLQTDTQETGCGETTEELEDETDPRDGQIADLSDKFIRLAAEYDNYRRRSQKEKDALYNESIATVAQAWLPVIDNLERASLVSTEFQNEETQRIKSGVDMIVAQAKDAVNSLGIIEIPALGKAFDPNSMEAIMHVEDDTVGESQVVEVFKKGYMRGDRVIRHAIVKVAN
jgi:molecular chaperone GrpE